MENNVYKKLIAIQTELKAPKSQYNSFGKYAYRNCEDILEALKPLLKKNNATICISDNIEEVQNRIYVKSTVTFCDCDTKETITCSAFAREEESKKGMDSSQLTGSTSSYARKYALNGMFCIDDTKDADSQDNSDKPAKTQTKQSADEKQKCSCCGKEFTAFDWNGKHYTEKQAIHFAKERGNEKYPLLCGQCYKKIKK